MSSRQRPAVDPDELSLRRASRVVGLQFVLATGALVVVILIATFSFVLAHIKVSHLFEPGRHEGTIDVGGLDILIGAIVIGVLAILAGGALSWYATRRAVRPLGDALRSQRAFVANASHELRTPLAVLDARLQYLQRNLESGDPSEATVAELRRDTGTLIGIVNDLLASAEQVSTDGERATELNPIVDLAVESMRLLAVDRDVAIELHQGEPLATVVPAASIHRCLVAVLDNALKYSPAGSTITVRVASARGAISISIADQGHGIQGIDPDRVFERFARGDAGTDDRGSFGIGLSLVRDTLERSGGSARVARTSADGTEIVLTMPGSEAPRRRRPHL